MTTIRLGTVAPSRLNLDGDQGNLLALKKYLEAAAFEVEVHNVKTTDEALACHFLLLGHGSMAAMASIDGLLNCFDWQLVTARVPGLAVGSAVEWLATQASIGAKLNRIDRISEFRVGSLGSIQALGYRNSDTSLPDFQLADQFILTTLHGPVLAKNPRLLHKAANAAVRCAALSFPKPAPDSLTDWVTRLNRICVEIWQLETEVQYQPLVIN